LEELIKPIKVMSSRHSAFYTPLLLAVELGSTDQSFMKSMSEDFECSYSVAENNENVYEKISNGEIDIAQSSVSGSWGNKYSKDIVHFAEINKMDGFHLVQRSDNENDEKFDWEMLNQKEILVDHSSQPLYMFKYACSKKNINFDNLNVIDAGSPENMIKKFREGKGDFIHLQAPQSIDLTYDQFDEEGKNIIRSKVGNIVEYIGKIIGPLSFSTLICKREYLDTKEYHKFIEIFHTTKLFAQTQDPSKISEIIFEFFPETDVDALEKTISIYQKLNCWNGEVNISEDHYDTTLEVFRNSGVEGIFPYSEIVHQH
tara:strand:+ start:1891 stop:2835 length:945 start_codon:yes stop_codon:yes gene_type:complete